MTSSAGASSATSTTVRGASSPSLELRAAQMQLGTRLDPDAETVLSSAVGELQQAVTELRELAAGVHPAVLTEDGLEAALDSLAQRTPVPVAVTTMLAGRPPPEIEAAAYFVACEALANAVKHAAASSVTISAVSRNGSLVIEVSDDGVGGADPGERGRGCAASPTGSRRTAAAFVS